MNKFFEIILLCIHVGVSMQQDNWQYLTKCTVKSQNTNLPHQQHYEVNRRRQVDPSASVSNLLMLKCPLASQFMYMGATQYGVSRQPATTTTTTTTCQPVDAMDCMVSVDYLANECNGLNTCTIQLDAQYLHTCRNYSDYLSIKYKCIDSKYKIDVCSNANRRIASTDNIYLTTPNYPLEYDNQANCTCELEAMDANGTLSVSFENYEFDVEEGDAKQCNKDRLDINKGDLLLCGTQREQFKEFTVKKNKTKTISMQFLSDDAITRRGFLLKIKKQLADWECPFNSDYLTSTKCIKYIDRELSNQDAQAYCGSLNGNLLAINGFVDNIKLAMYVKNKAASGKQPKQLQRFWSIVNSRNQMATRNSSLNKCSTYVDGTWSTEWCRRPMPFMCEFNSHPVMSMKHRHNQVAASGRGHSTMTIRCGTSRATPNQVDNKQQQHEQPSLLVIQQESYIQQQTTTMTSRLDTLLVPASRSSSLAVIIGCICGISIVILFVNLFCIWNYYNRKIQNLSNKTKNSQFLSLSSSSSSSSTTATNITNDLIYLNDNCTPMNDTCHHNGTKDQPMAPHLYDTIQSLYYSQLQNPYDSFNANTSATLIIDTSKSSNKPTMVAPSNAIILLNNGHNVYMSCLSPSMVSTRSSSTQPLTTIHTNII